MAEKILTTKIKVDSSPIKKPRVTAKIEWKIHR